MCGIKTVVVVLELMLLKQRTFIFKSNQIEHLRSVGYDQYTHFTFGTWQLNSIALAREAQK
jgi:hypothetical protein